MKRAKSPGIQAFVSRRPNGRYGVVIWGGPHNGFVGDFRTRGLAYLQAVVSDAAIIHDDRRKSPVIIHGGESHFSR